VPVAELALRPDPACAAGCTLVISGTGPDDLQAEVDGERVPVTRDSSGSLELPIPVTDPESAVWVTLTRSSGGTLGMSMTGLSLVPATTKGQA
jgi:hypothetical protein